MIWNETSEKRIIIHGTWERNLKQKWQSKVNILNVIRFFSFFILFYVKWWKFSLKTFFFCIIKNWNFLIIFSTSTKFVDFLLLQRKKQYRLQKHRLSCESCCQLTIHNALLMYRQYVFIWCSLMIKFKLKKKNENQLRFFIRNRTMEWHWGDRRLLDKSWGGIWRGLKKSMRNSIFFWNFC